MDVSLCLHCEPRKMLRVERRYNEQYLGEIVLVASFLQLSIAARTSCMNTRGVLLVFRF
jgi:hypothetical protein